MGDVLLGLLLLPLLLGTAAATELSLHRKLLASYDRTVRPAERHNSSLAVVFGLALTQIIDVDERNQVGRLHCNCTNINKKELN